MSHSGCAGVGSKLTAAREGALARRARAALGSWLLALSATITPSSQLYAQATPASGSCAPPHSSRSAAPAERVAALYQSFECHFARAEYAACLPYLEQACQLTDSPRCLLNLGAVHHALMHCQLARGYYQRYLDRSPYDEHVAAARSALEELERACPRAGAPAAAASETVASETVASETAASETAASETAAPRIVAPAAVAPPAREAPAALQPAVPSASPQRQPTGNGPASVTGQQPRAAAPALAPDSGARSNDRVLEWSLLGASAATLTATVVLAAYGARAERDYEARASRLEPPARGSDAELRAIDERGDRSNQLALGLGVLSGLLAGAGATLWLMDAGEAESGLGLTITPDGTALSSYSGRF